MFEVVLGRVGICLCDPLRGPPFLENKEDTATRIVMDLYGPVGCLFDGGILFMFESADQY